MGGEPAEGLLPPFDRTEDLHRGLVPFDGVEEGAEGQEGLGTSRLEGHGGEELGRRFVVVGEARARGDRRGRAPPPRRVRGGRNWGPFSWGWGSRDRGTIRVKWLSFR